MPRVQRYRPANKTTVFPLVIPGLPGIGVSTMIPGKPGIGVYATVPGKPGIRGERVNSKK